MEKLTIATFNSSKADDQRAGNMQLSNMHTATRGFAGRHSVRGAFISIERAIENLIDDSSSDRYQYQVCTSLPPLVAIVVRKPAEQSTIEFFGNPRRQRFSAGEIFLNAGGQGGPGAPVVAITAHDSKDATVVDAGAVTPIAIP